MESSSVLVALEELERWRSRRARLEEELVDLRKRRAEIQAKLEKTKREVASLKDVLFKPTETSETTFRQPPFRIG